MLPILAYIIVSVFLVSSIAFVAIYFMKAGEKKLFFFVSFAAGSMLAAAFLDLFPEALEKGRNAPVFALLGVVAFFLMERLIWHHHHINHKNKSQAVSLVYLVTVGDAIHNFIDGSIIAASFLVNIQLGIAATIAIVMHEIPQELGDAGILLHSGMGRFKAAMLNFVTGLTAMAGALLTFFFFSHLQGINNFLIGFAAGGFIYIAVGDLLPELNKEHDTKASSIQLAVFLLGIVVIWAVRAAVG
ncbi:ZIP family metal transporter [Candidatus Woesearchaeota archaeon]|nr:ZIP family metal transporter [Candidatus Woesearchaeota archaeon]